uniref:Interleukin 23 receptor n=1 Tax=Myripristis murdjan TaxID=586833 RepID=A0A667XG12_9TELE
MNPFQTIWTYTITFLFHFSIRRCPLLLVGCQPVICQGYLTVEPAPLFLMGSDLTVFCRLTHPKCESFRLSLHFNGRMLEPEERVNCMARFRLTNVHKPKFGVTCKMKRHGLTETVCGLDLLFMEPGQETHLLTTYNISVTRENGSQIHSDLLRNTTALAVPRTMFEENEKYLLIITACNDLGKSKSDPFILCLRDVVIPDTPRIVEITFWNNSIVAMLRWEIPEPSEHLRFFVRHRNTGNGPWLRKGLLQVGGLKPLTEYEFQIRACSSTSGPSATLTPRPSCSKWSPSVRKKTPGKVTREINRLQNVTVLWKPPSPEDYSGEVQQYEIFMDNSQKPAVTCPAAVNQCAVQVSSRVQTLSVSAVTSYGKSPPAAVPLRHSGVPGPALKEPDPAGNSSVMVVSWSWSRSASAGELLDYVVEWRSGAPGMHWQRVSKDQNIALIPGLSAGVRYEVSLYAVTIRGVSEPSFRLVYSQEQVSGPKLSVLDHQARRILIQWEELAVDQQRGFITHYTIYLLPNRLWLNDADQNSLSEPGSRPRQMWLDCPEGALALSLSASNSAGEGPQGNWVYSQPPDSAGETLCLVIATLFIAFIANLMCWRCIRERMKQKCLSMGPSWLAENLPKPGNSNAIKLLKDERSASEESWSFTYSDPPLSPIEEIPQEQRDELYPIIHIEWDDAEVGQSTAEATLQMADTGTTPLEHVSYKPQNAPSAPLREDEEDVKDREEEQWDVPAGVQEDRGSVISGGLLGGLLSNVEVNFSSLSLGLTLSSVSGFLRPQTPETTSIFKSDCLLGETGAERVVEVGSTSLNLQQCEKMTLNEAHSCLSEYTVETTLTSGYFAQAAAPSRGHN